MPYPGYTTEEIARRGQELYENNIRRRVEPEQIGRFLVVDVESGDYEVAEDDLSASDRMLARRPDATLYELRVGHDYAYRLGGEAGKVLGQAPRRAKQEAPPSTWRSRVSSAPSGRRWCLLPCSGRRVLEGARRLEQSSTPASQAT